MSFTINNGADSPLESIYATDYWIVNKWFGDRLWGWGQDNYGQLGDNARTNQSVPVQSVSSVGTWKLVACADQHSAAIKTDGTLWTWGYNTFGALGDNTTSHKSSPVQTVAGGTNWKVVTSGSNINAAIKTDGTLWVWGNNGNGQLGDGTTTVRTSPVQTISGSINWKQVSCGISYMAAIKTDGTLWLWGYNGGSVLGDNTASAKSSPVQTVAGGSNWSSVACGYLHTMATKTDGTLWTWGSNTYGQLGTNNNTNVASPVQTVSGGTNWKQVACGYSHSVATKTDGTLWTWGRDDYGQLGDNSNTHKSSPVQTVAGGTNWKQISCGHRHYTTALRTDGTLWTWGVNTSGQLGDSSVVSRRSSPVQVYGNSTNWKSVYCGGFHALAIQINNINTTGT